MNHAKNEMRSTMKSLLLFLPLTSGVALAQHPMGEPAPREVLSVRDRASGMIATDAGFLAAGPRYKALLDEQGVTFVPALGHAVEVNVEVRLELERVQLGEDVLFTAASSAAGPGRLDEQRLLRRERSSWLEERFEATADGLEHSFLFRELPAGSGDLVLRSRLDVPLDAAPEPTAAGGLAWDAPGIGGITFGAVTAIDASGARARGLLRAGEGWIEYVVPAAFLADASLPLLVDPLINGFVTAVGAGGGVSESFSDVTYIPSTDEYFVIWSNDFGNFDADIYGQKVTPAGALVGPLALVAVNTFFTRETNPTVVQQDAGLWTNAPFLAVFYEASDFILGNHKICYSLRSATDPSIEYDLRIIDDGSLGSCHDPDVGVEFDGTINAVYSRGGEIHGANLVGIFPEPIPSIQSNYLVSAVGVNSNPSISKVGLGFSGLFQGGVTGRHLIVWEREGAGPNMRTIEGAFALSSGPGIFTVSPSFTVADTGDSSEPDCATRGFLQNVAESAQEFVVAWAERPSGTTGPRSIRMRWGEYDPTDCPASCPKLSGYSDVSDLLLGGTADEGHPALAYVREEYVVAWSRDATGATEDGPIDREIVVAEVETDQGEDEDLGAFESCGPVTVLETATRDDLPAVSGAQSENSTQAQPTDHALLTWTSSGGAFPTTGTAQSTVWEAVGPGGPVVDLGGGCGSGGTATILGEASLGNPDFFIQLADASPSSPFAILNLNTSSGLILPCGPCLYLDYLLIFTPVISGGFSTFNLPLPCDQSLLGGTLRFQWTVFFSGINPCPIAPPAFSPSLSNIMQVVLGN